MKMLLLIPLLLSLLILSGCGQPGPLYLPTQAKPIPSQPSTP